MYKSNEDKDNGTSESFSESESENESDLEDTSINFINETAISTITSSSTNDSFHHHTTASSICIGCEHNSHLHPKGCFELYHTKDS